MTTSPSTLVLSKPTDNDAIPETSISYLRTRNRLKAFDLIQLAFDKAGITQAGLAARLQKDPGQLSRLLNAPGNWTLDTISDLLFAINGGVPAYTVDYPLDKAKRNRTQPTWARDNLNPAHTGGDASFVEMPSTLSRASITSSG